MNLCDFLHSPFFITRETHVFWDCKSITSTWTTKLNYKNEYFIKRQSLFLPSLLMVTVSSLLCIPQWHSSLHHLVCIKIRQSKLGTQQGLHNILLDPQKLGGKVIKPSADYFCEAWVVWKEIQNWSICGVWAILLYIKKPKDHLSPEHRETFKLPWKKTRMMI